MLRSELERMDCFSEFLSVCGWVFIKILLHSWLLKIHCHYQLPKRLLLPALCSTSNCCKIAGHAEIQEMSSRHEGAKWELKKVFMVYVLEEMSELVKELAPGIAESRRVGEAVRDFLGSSVQPLWITCASVWPLSQWKFKKKRKEKVFSWVQMCFNVCKLPFLLSVGNTKSLVPFLHVYPLLRPPWAFSRLSSHFSLSFLQNNCSRHLGVLLASIALSPAWSSIWINRWCSWRWGPWYSSTEGGKCYSCCTW